MQEEQQGTRIKNMTKSSSKELRQKYARKVSIKCTKDDAKSSKEKLTKYATNVVRNQVRKYARMAARYRLESM